MFGCDGQQNIFQDNYGVNFRDTGLLEFVHEAWHHTFAVNMTFPRIPDVSLPCGVNNSSLLRQPGDRSRTPMTLLSPNMTVLDLICPTIRENQNRHKRIYRKIMALEKEFDLLIPDAKSPRRARGLLDIVGEVSKSLFGTATTKDQTVLKHHIEEIASATVTTDNRLSSLEDSLGSFLQKQSSHDDMFEKAIALTQEYLNVTELEMERQRNDLKLQFADAINVLHLSELHYVATLNDIYQELKGQVDGMHDLLEGYLPRKLITAKELRNVLKHVSSELATRRAELTHTNHVYYYHINDIDFTREGNILFIKMKIPITRTDALFRLYYAQVVPIPIAPGRNEHSIIKLDFKYLAVNKEHSLYGLLTESDYSFCQGQQYRRCDSLYRVYKASEPTCLFALFKGLATEIKSLCKTILSDPPTDFVMSLTAGQYYLSTQDETWTQKCATGPPKQMSACSHCIVTLPCQCSLRGRRIRIPSRFEDCLNSTTLQIKHAINLPSLLAFYGDNSEILKLSAKQRFNSPANITVPKLHIIKDEYKDVIAKLKTEDISLHTLANRIRNDKKTYASPTAKLRQDLGILTKTPTESLFGISGLSLLIAFLAMFIALRNARVVMMATGAAGLALHPATKPPPPNDNITVSIEIASNVILSSITIFIMIAAIITTRLFVKRVMEACFRQPPNLFPIHSTLQLVFYSNGRFAMTELMVLPCDIKTVRICQRDTYRPPTVTSASCGTVYHVTFDWGFLDIRHDDGRRITLQPKVKFSSFITRGLRDLLHAPEEVRIVGCYQNVFFDLFTWKQPPTVPTPTMVSVNPTFRLDEEALEKLGAGVA